MSKIVDVVIYGASGFGGVGLVETLLKHPHVRLAALVSREGAGEPYSNLYPHLKGLADQIVEDATTFNPKGKGSFVFLSTPDGVGQNIAHSFLDNGYRLIDFSGDFRFSDNDTYKAYSAWQQGEQDHASPDLLEKAVYGCPELYRDDIKKADIVGNPGCMAISCILAMAPALKASLIKPGSIFLDSKTGISGAGKKPKAPFHFPFAFGNAYAYKIGKHQHIFEMEREFSNLTAKEIQVNFIPNVIPVSRGILSTCVARLNEKVESKTIEETFCNFYQGHPFIQLDFSGRSIGLTEVNGTNMCRLGIHHDQRTQTLVVTSVIDNLQKGQAGNAIQVMNIMLGMAEDSGLEKAGRVP